MGVLKFLAKASFPIIICLMLGCLGLLQPRLVRAQVVVNPWVTTDRSVNCFSAATIVEDLTRGLDNPQDKSIAVFNFFQRTMFPFSNRAEYPFPQNDQSHMFDFVRMVNVYGYALCTQNNWMFAGFLNQSGFVEEARGISVPGHGTAEVKWGGKWHFMDAIVGCYALNRTDGQIASIDEIVADPSLLGKAKAQGRASVPFCPWDAEELYPFDALAQFDQWYTYRKYGLNFLLDALPHYKPAGPGEPVSHTMAFGMRPGFRLTRMWDKLPGMYNLSYEYYRNKNTRGRTTPSQSLLPPHHPANSLQEHDALNFPLLKAYGKQINGKTSYRYYANGVLCYQDNFCDERILQGADSVKALRVDTESGVLSLEPGRDTGEVILTFSLPYVFVGGKVSFRVEMVDGGWAAAFMDVPSGVQWVSLGMASSGGDFSFSIPQEMIMERYEFRIKLRLHGAHGPASVKLHQLKAEGVCQLNMHSLPFLAPGSNRVNVQAQTLPQGTALAVTYKWQENGWDRTDSQVVKKAGTSYTIDVAGEEYPRMKELTIECLPR
ncbi:MAG: hypothetical protein HOC20_10485 [Chloroflexi bacterium]|nr:hypothetical protein [Chloroflexota bacterium]